LTYPLIVQAREIGTIVLSSGLFPSLARQLAEISPVSGFGEVTAVTGLTAEVQGLRQDVAVGGRVAVESLNGTDTECEVIGFRDGRVLVMPYAGADTIALGATARPLSAQAALWPTDQWLGRVVNALGLPVDGGPALPVGHRAAPMNADPPPAHARRRLGDKVDLGVRALNTFLTCVEGQRMGIFAGSGVGKSSLMSMIARSAKADVFVVGLVGERGREVQEFIEDDLGPEGLARSVVVVATSDEAPLMRRSAAQATLAVAEHFRRQGRSVVCMMDSVTRFCMAQREIGLAAGEPPTTKGYPPSTFAHLARLLERAGPGHLDEGHMTGLFTVLVDGDDHNEPVPTPRAASWTATSCCPAPSPNGAAIRPSTF